ncbi:unnamed protein product [Hymenolepis diminuta]|uniref:Uncharacterized protein n=1 Tax=Hymenolepis diminuta TaxID=6216 RepID=A0A3P6Z582_HYMDI|nr:unnamed protein product [Hymenolepis diminuta]
MSYLLNSFRTQSRKGIRSYVVFDVTIGVLLWDKFIKRMR